MKKCHRCEQLPEGLPTGGKLYIAPPEEGAAARLRKACSELGIEVTTPLAGVYGVSLDDGRLNRLCNYYFAHVSALEQQDTKCLLMPDDAEPSLQDLLKMQSLGTLLARVEGEWLLGVLRDQRLVTFFQPIVPCTDPKDVFAYECLIRGRADDGRIIPPGDLFRCARSADLLFQLDRASRISAIRDAQRQGIRTRIFINFTPSSIYDPAFCLRTTVAAIAETDLKPENVVFEVVESDEVGDVGHLLDILRYYRDHGYRVALDDLGAGYGSLNLLHQLQPDFIKLDMDLVRNVHKDPYKARISENLLALANSLGVRSIAEGVETPDEWEWLKAHGADLVQGYLFARPSETPPTIAVQSS
ncbi:MAG: EAL domain-containing protein [Candidatus Hydrogenedentes bacterium]|nr:EAL domain-containing protein [Candidatus Hydrogenedentota bacterium]